VVRPQLFALLKTVSRHRYFPENWIPPNPPELQLIAGGNYEPARKEPELGNVRMTLCGGNYGFGEDDGQDLGTDLRNSLISSTLTQ
jgi:hypothetical protein